MTDCPETSDELDGVGVVVVVVVRRYYSIISIIYYCSSIIYGQAVEQKPIRHETLRTST